MHSAGSCAALLLAGLLAGGPAWAQSHPVRVRVNGHSLRFHNVKPVTGEGHVVVPLDRIMKQVGGTTDFNAMGNHVTAALGGVNVQMKIGSSTALVNGRSVPMSIPPLLANGHTMVPLSLLNQAFGADAHWSRANTISMKMPAARRKTAHAHHSRSSLHNTVKNGYYYP